MTGRTVDLVTKSKNVRDAWKIKRKTKPKKARVHTLRRLFCTERDEIILSIERWRQTDWNKFGSTKEASPFGVKKKREKERGRRCRKFTGPSDKIHAWLIPAYSGLSQSFLPRLVSFLVPITSNQRQRTMWTCDACTMQVPRRLGIATGNIVESTRRFEG